MEQAHDALRSVREDNEKRFEADTLQLEELRERWRRRLRRAKTECATLAVAAGLAGVFPVLFGVAIGLAAMAICSAIFHACELMNARSTYQLHDTRRIARTIVWNHATRNLP